MIGRRAIDDRVREWGLREDVVEKAYVLGWLLWAIGADPTLNATWVFKGGTCLKKCHIETYRFSQARFTLASWRRINAARRPLVRTPSSGSRGRHGAVEISATPEPADCRSGQSTDVRSLTISHAPN
jgi:hypothetical protein